MKFHLMWHSAKQGCDSDLFQVTQSAEPKIVEEGTQLLFMCVVGFWAEISEPIFGKGKMLRSGV